ncbi:MULTISPECIES: hypothetical protein [Pectobacterium]|uniref:hypothetical protein n=1 Tax=Pectobacterium TaxID=122277 RepID=UPI000582CC9B|nr:hypothetical protein [Pectobacterium brasiliense]KHS81103.1 hypothetical protein RC81_00540 [Pectobacterium brasiliense]
MSVSRILIENNGSNQNNIKLAISKTYHLCKDAGLQRITLLFPAKGTFSHSDIATFLGELAVKALLKEQGFRTTEEEIRQFAVNNGWEPVRAKELASFAKKYIG